MGTSFHGARPPAASSEYQDALKQLTLLVRGKVMTPAAGDSIFNLHHSILQSSEIKPARNGMATIFIEDAEKLLEHAKAGRALVGSASLFSSAEAGDRLLERLTGTWLAMYFLGCPSIQPWETVAFFAEGSGFPRGASLCKAVGDVYRRARKAYRALPQQEQDSVSAQLVYVLDHNPLAIQGMMDRIVRSANDENKPTTRMLSLYNNIAMLGILYERLQLALYLHAGAPMRFYVPHSSLRSAMRRYAEKTARSPGAWEGPEEIMWRQIKSCFLEKYASKQLVHLSDDETLSYMPGCVLAPREGVYRPREVVRRDKQAPPGNYLPTRVHADFRKTMAKATPPPPANPLQCDHERFVAECKRVTYL